MRKTNPPDRKFKVKCSHFVPTLPLFYSVLSPSLSNFCPCTCVFFSPFLSLSTTSICIVPFQGSVFVEFCEEEDFEKFLRLDVVMFRDKELLRESK